MSDLEARLVQIIRATPTTMQVLRTIRDLDLPDAMIFSGAIYQPVWNHLTGRAPDYGIKDYDVAYHDDSDTSYEAEDVFPAALLDGVLSRLRTHDEESPMDEVTSDDDARAALVRRFWHVG